MKKTALSVFIVALWATGFSQTLSFKFGTPFRRADLDVRWNVPSNSLPASVSCYRMLPNRFSPEIISNVTAFCSFTAKERTRSDTNWLVFESSDRTRRLGFFFPSGSIEYQTPEIYSPTNLIQGVLSEDQLRKLAPGFLPKLGIHVSDIDRQENGEPDLRVFDSEIMFSVNHVIITNTVYRGIRFRRNVEGLSFTGGGSGGDCEVHFGDHGKVVMLSLSWRRIEHYKRYATASPQTLASWIRQGKAVLNMLPGDVPGIDWNGVKSLTLKKAQLCCYAGEPFKPSDWLIPFVAFVATVDTGDRTLDLEIDCPIADQSMPLKANIP
jgi:hypothetical protein